MHAKPYPGTVFLKVAFCPSSAYAGVIPFIREVWTWFLSQQIRFYYKRNTGAIHIAPYNLTIYFIDSQIQRIMRSHTWNMPAYFWR